MTAVPTTILTPAGTTEVDATVDGGRVLLTPADLPSALGWELKPEGLCQGDRCVPVRDRDALLDGDRIDAVAVAELLGSRTMLDADAEVLAVSVARTERALALRDRTAPDFELPDLDGVAARLSDWRGRRRLLVAFASW